ncbi:MAG: phosphatase PAP2 family protein [Patescibacteria group bacterium]|nr:phosphatase PAP2 family protein [Patescibacteria group bacterium]
MNEVIKISAEYLIYLTILIELIAWWTVKKEDRIKIAILIIIAGAIAFTLRTIGGALYYDPRPFVVEHVKPLVPHAPDNGFPSDHALLSGTLTAVTFFFSKKYGYLLLVLTVIIGVARVLAKVHTPLDIGAGWIFGIIGAVCSYYIVNLYIKKKLPNYNPK